MNLCKCVKILYAQLFFRLFSSDILCSPFYTFPSLLQMLLYNLFFLFPFLLQMLLYNLFFIFYLNELLRFRANHILLNYNANRLKNILILLFGVSGLTVSSPLI